MCTVNLQTASTLLRAILIWKQTSLDLLVIVAQNCIVQMYHRQTYFGALRNKAFLLHTTAFPSSLLYRLKNIDFVLLFQTHNTYDKWLGESRFKTTLDLTIGYWQVPLTPSDREKTASSTPTGLFQY